MLRAKKIVLVPETVQMSAQDDDLATSPGMDLGKRLDGLFPTWIVSVQCAQSHLARSLAEGLGDVFETQLAPNAWLNAGAPRPAERMDEELERLRSGADAVLVVADADALGALALYYLRQVRGEPYMGKLPDFGADETMVLDLWAGVFQTVRLLSSAH